MDIKKETIDNIVNVFNESIKSYNGVVELRKSSQDILINQFNSSLQYYSAIESAFRTVITNTLKKTCPKDLHKMIEILIDQLNPNPLESGIDLFYILRYKDTRNDATHELKIQETNVYPRLFEIGARFIHLYINQDAVLSKWKGETKQFDYSSFNQIFRTSEYDYVRVLVLPPCHDYSKDQLKILFKYHWNIVLDFDPYSSTNGAYSIIQHDKTRLFQLSEIESYTPNDFSIEEITWIMCDGDKQFGIPSFKPVSKNNDTSFIPAMLNGPNNWSQCYNQQKSNLSTKKLLSKLFSLYFGKIQYNAEVLCLMDYARQVNDTIYSAITDNINQLTNNINVYYVNEALSEELYRESQNHNNWYIYDSSVDSFLEKVNLNVIGSKDSSIDSFILPCNSPCDGVISRKIYSHICQHFYMLHSSFPIQEDEPWIDTTKISEDMYNFSRGEEASWHLISKRRIPQFDIYNSALRDIENAISSGKRYFNLFHVAGFGGSTAAKQIAYELHTKYPILYMKTYDKKILWQRINQIYNLTRQRIVFFIEESLFDNVSNDRNECLRIAESTSAMVTFIFVGRRAQSTKVNKKDSFMIRKYGIEDINKLIDFNRQTIGVIEQSPKRNLFEETAADYIKNLGEENVCPFLVNLSIYKDKFIKVDEYVKPFAGKIMDKPVLKKVFVYSCIFSRFLNKGLPYQFIKRQLEIDGENCVDALKDEYDPLVYTKNNQEFHIKEISIRAPYLAECLLKRLIGNGEEGIAFREHLNSFLKLLIGDIKNFYADKQYANKCLRQMLIDKLSKENDYKEALEAATSEDILVIRKYFAPVIEKLWDKDNINVAGEVFEKLITEYSQDSYFYAHAARFYAYTGRNFELASTYYTKAINLIEANKEEANASDIYHVKGMCLSKQFFKMLEKLSIDGSLKGHIDFTQLKTIAKEAEDAFATTHKMAIGYNSKTVEYAYTAWLSLIVRLLIESKKYNMFTDSEIDKYIETSLSLISELEEFFLLSGKDDLVENEDIFNDLSRKKELVKTYQKEFSYAISHWNNYHKDNKNDRNFTNCIYACKNRYYLLEQHTNNFTKVDEKNKERIQVLAEDYFDALIQLPVEKLLIGDLSIYIALVRFSNIKVNKLMSVISNVYLYSKNKVDIKVLFYRYVLKFICAYGGDRLALQECISYIEECKKHCEKIPGKTNSLEFYRDGIEMNCLASKKWLITIHPELRTQIYKAKELGFLKGVLKQTGNETTIIPYDKNGVLMVGIEVHANLKYNPNVETSDSGVKVKFKMGFSFDGLKAENMSINYDQQNEEKVADNLNLGDVTEFVYQKTLINKNNGNAYAIVGFVGINEYCILHIKQISRNFVKKDEFEKLIDYCKKNTVTVQLINKTEQGWEGSLKNKTIDFNKLKNL